MEATWNLRRQRALEALRAGLFTNYLKTGVLLAGLTSLAVLVAHHFGGAGWAAGVLVVMGLMNLGSWWFSDRIVLAMHGATELPVREAPHVHAMVERLASRAGIPKPRLVYVPDHAPNAFATGRDPEHAVVAVTHGILELLDDDELEGVLAHELAHVINRDVLVMTVAATIAGAISLLARMAGWAMLFGGRSSDDERGNPLEGLVLLVFAPVTALIVQMAVSRSREYGADARGALLAGDPAPLARALRKLELQGRRVPMLTANPATAHLYICEPLAATGGAAMGVLHLFSTHPPIDERIRRLLALR